MRRDCKKGSKTLEEKRKVAQDLLKTCKKNEVTNFSSSKMLDQLMETLDGEDNFLTED